MFIYSIDANIEIFYQPVYWHIKLKKIEDLVHKTALIKSLKEPEV
jgi:hypothetical protein